ncbi:MAG: DegT/DnrJ/EryC1/StrS family aminotransferase [Candidatus Symbiobacter sp.]|nr:DegT/DnrJ/EryC1/StrS family aminotransferase [Candidatus Symbiobacter sp.]
MSVVKKVPMTEDATLPLTPLGFAAPKQQYLAQKNEIDQAITRVLTSEQYILGREVAAFEQEFAAYCGVAHAIGVANGTDALHLALRALNIGAGDEVITTPMTAVATVAAIGMSGAKAVFADIRPEHGLLDLAKLSGVVTPRCRAIMPVHLYGHPLNMAELLAWAAQHHVAVIEDCAQAVGAEIDLVAPNAPLTRHKMGSLGVMGCFSFYPTKNLGAMGDGGAVITQDAGLAAKLRGLRQYGWSTSRNSEFPGYNSRLDEIQAAILRVKLPHLDANNLRRRRIAEAYLHGLSGIPDLRLPWPTANTHPAWHLFVMQCRSSKQSPDLRDKLKEYLASQRIHAGIHYPVPIYQQPAYRQAYPHLSLPVTEAVTATVLSLPIYPELSLVEVERVIRAIKGFFAQ